MNKHRIALKGIIEIVKNLIHVAEEIYTINLSAKVLVSFAWGQRYADVHSTLSKPNKRLEVSMRNKTLEE